ncbi:hypothetical protein [Peptacetobacter hiranonis]|uniref:Uncharacterized protein n=1 Tax=Peptacetobacter hiranonis (strain DSM 13275 / JCM 10541 / KCTC 15199 / TO-931) TaxID=500633 RepID=B6FY22_PEPHT|nr:hypothetical protein [Peptacetobacter hiranonis]EEA85569.1 hypothetical protein CLOHIR_00773 [Peptacetobacter hiranonis DSM 13275]QEK20073.1 hypothetical protein KGNDJEFE_00554 [Peptacetobacter hiranonis]
MKNDVFYTLIETVVANKLKDMEKYPERAARNLIDLGLLFSKGKFQNSFFSSAQTMLQNEESPYYKLISNVVNGVENQRLLTFGMNLGYNSFKCGSKIIRRNERKLNCIIPWEITLHIDSFSFKNNNQHYDKLITDGEKLGIYSWIIFLNNPSTNFLDLIKRHPDSVFFIFLENLDIKNCDMITDIDKNFWDCVEELENIMLIVELDKKNRHVYNELSSRKLLYSVYYRYSQKNIDLILDGSILRFAEQFNPFFTVFVSEPHCNDNLRKMVYQISEQTRTSPSYSTIAWELFYSNAYIDNIISGKSRYISFDHSGNLCTVDGKKVANENISDSSKTENVDTAGFDNLEFDNSKENNIFYSDLISILKSNSKL